VEGRQGSHIVPVAGLLLSLSCRRTSAATAFPCGYLDLFTPSSNDSRMANNKSQMKRNRQNEVRRMANKSVRSEVRTAMKRAISAAEAGEPTEELYRQAQKKIDKAVAKGVLKPNTGARRKARLAAKL